MPIYTPGKVVLKKDSVATDPNFDPNFANVSLLLHGDGTNGSTTITDSSPSPKTVTAVGNAQISTAQSKFGGASILLDGNGDYVESANNAAFDFGSADFTIECWFYIAGNSQTDPDGNRFAALVTSMPVATPITGYELNVGGSASLTGTSLRFNNWQNTSSSAVTYTGTISQLAWHHVAVVKSSTTTILFFNGVQVASTTLANQNVNNSTHPLRIGSNRYASYFHQFNGYIDDLRITKGVARYTAAFTPPTTSFPDR
jgi:hypothetical protein